MSARPLLLLVALAACDVPEETLAAHTAAASATERQAPVPTPASSAAP